MKRNHSAFTLIELLVVIAIIAILAAILFPVFAQAKLAAKKTADLSNMKQMGTSIQMYLADSDDVYPLSYFWNNARPYSEGYAWSSVGCVGNYTKNTDILKSPVDSNTQTHNAAYYGMVATRVPKPISYLTNGITPAYFMFGTNTPRGLMPQSPSMPPIYGGSTSVSATSATEASNPADILLLLNGYKEWYGDLYGCTEWINNEIDWCYVGNTISEQWAVDFLALAAPTAKWYPAWRKFSGGANYAFGDSHAKLLRPTEIRDARRWIVNAP